MNIDTEAIRDILSSVQSVAETIKVELANLKISQLQKDVKNFGDFEGDICKESEDYKEYEDKSNGRTVVWHIYDTFHVTGDKDILSKCDSIQQLINTINDKIVGIVGEEGNGKKGGLNNLIAECSRDVDRIDEKVAAAEHALVWTDSTSLNFRAEPGTDSKVLKSLPKGSSVTVLDNPFIGPDGMKWVKVQAGGIGGAVGYVAAKYLKSDFNFAGTTYTVESGDNLWNIAEKVYGDGNKYTEIAKFNNIKDPSYIAPGQVIRLPDESLRNQGFPDSTNLSQSVPYNTTKSFERAKQLEKDKNNPYAVKMQEDYNRGKKAKQLEAERNNPDAVKMQENYNRGKKAQQANLIDQGAQKNSAFSQASKDSAQIINDVSQKSSTLEQSSKKLSDIANSIKKNGENIANNPTALKSEDIYTSDGTVVITNKDKEPNKNLGDLIDNSTVVPFDKNVEETTDNGSSITVPSKIYVSDYSKEARLEGNEFLTKERLGYPVDINTLSDEAKDYVSNAHWHGENNIPFESAPPVTNSIAGSAHQHEPITVGENQTLYIDGQRLSGSSGSTWQYNPDTDCYHLVTKDGDLATTTHYTVSQMIGAKIK